MPALLASASAQAPAKSSATAAAPKGAHPKSKAEGDALNALNKMAKDSATTGDQLDAAVTDFVTKYPTSDYLASVAVFALQYYQTAPHASYEKSLLYGEQAIKADPTSIYALTTVGDIIPNQVKDTDLDRDQRIKEATDADNQAIHVVETSGDTINGQPFPLAAKHVAEAIAYSSLARIANLNKDYAQVVANYQKAIPLDEGRSQAGDYFYLARAQIEMKQYTEALASLDAAAKDAPADPAVQAAVASNRKFIAQQQKAGH
ncbi:MAG: hypothetical protein ACRD1E_01720 [Terriglobales bacterium]